MTYVCESLNRKKGEIEVEDNCTKDKHTYHMRVF